MYIEPMMGMHGEFRLVLGEVGSPSVGYCLLVNRNNIL